MRCVHARENTRHERERVSNARQTQRTIVSANERIGVLVLQLTVDVLFSLLHRNVHEAVQATQDAWRSRRTKKKHDDNKSQISMPRATTRRDATRRNRTVILDATVQLYNNALANDLLQELGRLLRHSAREASENDSEIAANNENTYTTFEWKSTQSNNKTK